MAQWYKSSSMPETLTQKTINADDNTLSNIEVDNLKTTAVATAISGSPVDSKLSTEKAVSDALATKQNIVQFATAPAASASNVGQVIQYIGTTTTDFINGYFYQCAEVTPATTPATYHWVAKNVQAGGASAWADITGKPFSTLGDDFIVDSAEDKLHVKAVTSVSSWQTTTDDLHFPTEKLVKSALDGKQADILTSISGTAGQVLARNSANNALEFKNVSGGSVDIDEVTIIKDENDKIKTCIGGGKQWYWTYNSLPDDVTGTYTEIAEYGAQFISFYSWNLLEYWRYDSSVYGKKFDFKLTIDGVELNVSKELSDISIPAFGVSVYGMQITGTPFGDLIFGRLSIAGLNTIAMLSSDPTFISESHTYNMSSIVYHEKTYSVQAVDSEYLNVDSHVFTINGNSPKKLGLKYEFGTWQEATEVRYAHTSSYSSTTATTITMPIGFVESYNRENLRGKEFKIQYDGQFTASGDKFGGFITGKFADDYPNEIVPEWFVDDNNAFTGGSIRIPVSSIDNTLIISEPSENPKYDFSQGFSWGLQIYVNEYNDVVHKIDKDYIPEVDGESFAKVSTTYKDYVWGIDEYGYTQLIEQSGGGDYLPLTGGTMTGTIWADMDDDTEPFIETDNNKSLKFKTNGDMTGAEMTLRGGNAGGDFVVKSGSGSYLRSYTDTSGETPVKKLLFGTSGTSSDAEITTANNKQHLTNKSINCSIGSGAGNTVTNIGPDNFTVYTTSMAGKVLAINSDGTVFWTGAGVGNYKDLLNRPKITVGDSDIVIDDTHPITYYGAISATSTDTLKNKTIDCATTGTGAGSNVITNLPISAFPSQATTEAGKCLGVKSDGTIGYINPSLIGNVNSVETTLTFAGALTGYTGTLTAEEINKLATTPCVLRLHLESASGTFDLNVGSMGYWKNLAGDVNYYCFDCVAQTGSLSLNNFLTWRGYVKIETDGTGSVLVQNYGEYRRYSIIYLTEDATTHVWSVTADNYDVWAELTYGNRNLLLVFGSDITTDNRVSIHDVSIDIAGKTASFDCFLEVSGSRTYYHGTAVYNSTTEKITYTLTPYNPLLESYPVGSIFFSGTADPQVNPETAFGGTWTEVTTTLGNVIMYRRTA